MRKIQLILILSLILILATISFILAYNIPNFGETVVSSESQHITPEKSQVEKDCNRLGFCWNNNRCYSMGTRLTIPPEYTIKELSWKNQTSLYCGQDSKKFVSQKITGEIKLSWEHEDYLWAPKIELKNYFFAPHSKPAIMTYLEKNDY